MKQIEFRGSLSEVHQIVELWKAANPLVTIIDTGTPVRARPRDDSDAHRKTDWSITVEYEDPA